MKYLEKIIEYGLYLLVFLLPIQTRWIIRPGLTEYQTYSLYGTDILLIFILLLFIVYKFSIFNFQFSNNFQLINFQTNSKLGWLIGGLVVISFVSIFFALNKWLALYKFGWLILGAGLFWLVVRVKPSRAKLFWSLFVGLALQSLLAIWQFFTQTTFANKWLGLSLHQAAELGASVVATVGADGVGERWLRAYGGLDHPNILGGILAIGIILTINLIITYEKSFRITNYELRITSKMQEIILWIMLVLFSAALFFSFSRTAWLALALALAVMMIGAVRKKNFLAQKNILQAVLISGLIFFILFFQFPNLVVTRLYLNDRLEAKSNNERLESAKNSLSIIKKNWLAGSGIGNYTLALNRLKPGQESFYYQPAHDVYLLILSETGILGFISFLGLIGYLIIFNFQFSIFKQFSMNKFSKAALETRNWKLEIGRNDDGMSGVANLSVLTAVVVLMGFDHWLWSLHFGVLFFWLVLGLIADSEIEKS
ncbi:MAG: O-antigen ligase family protein [Parcubacteria group bacterium]|nr:O-antigen ligase family protein [Parcubacteria group bacterium]